MSLTSDRSRSANQTHRPSVGISSLGAAADRQYIAACHLPNYLRESGGFPQMAKASSPRGSTMASSLVSGCHQPLRLEAQPSIQQIADALAGAGLRTVRLTDLEWAAIENALAAHQGNRTHAAGSLGISVRTLQRKLKETRRNGRAASVLGVSDRTCVAAVGEARMHANGDRREA
jgi:DNA-binding NtrC family response regulator